MKRFSKSVPSLLSLTLLDLLIFTALYAFNTLIFKGFGFLDAFYNSAAECLWRIISLQIFIQFAFWVIASGFNFQQRYIYTLFLAFIAFSISSVLSFSNISSIWKLMQPPAQSEIGEGFAIMISVTTAYLVLYAFRGKVYQTP